jgi:hypothetical protein
LYNLTNGGEGNVGWIPSEETRAKMSEAQKGDKSHMYGKTRSAETRAKQSAAQKGENNHMYGKTGDKSHMYGKTGDKSPNYGKPISEEAKAKQREAMTKYLPEDICKYPNQKAATLATGISRASYYRLKKANPHLFTK